MTRTEIIEKLEALNIEERPVPSGSNMTDEQQIEVIRIIKDLFKE